MLPIFFSEIRRAFFSSCKVFHAVDFGAVSAMYLPTWDH